MKVAIDISPLTRGNFIQHRVRGTGFYLENLKESLLKYYPENSYTFFSRGEKLPININLVHFPYFEPFFLTLPFFKKNKTVVTIHDLTPLVFPKNFHPGVKGNIKWQLQKMALKRSECIITDSKSSKEDIMKFTGINETKIKVVYLAASENFKPLNDTLLLRRIRVKYSLPEKFVLYVGDVTWNKNLPRLLEAVQKIQIPIVLVGKALIEKDFDKNNPWNQDLVKVQKLCEEAKNIIRLGFVSTEDLVSIYNLATVFVMPSLYEGFGLPILEAMNCGCPVVTTKEGSIPEIAGDAAFYVDAYDVDDIAKGIKEVFNSDKLQTELSKKGLIRSKKFSWKKTAEETVAVYKKVLE